MISSGPEMLEQMHQELHNFLFADGLFEDLEIEVPPGHPCGYRDGLPVEVVLQHGCPPARRPGPVRPLA
jgi:hypothetical protein